MSRLLCLLSAHRPWERVSPAFTWGWTCCLKAATTAAASDCPTCLEWFAIHQKTATERDALQRRVERLEAVASGLVRQVEEFETWDQDDWPAALHALKGHAKVATAALAASQKEETP